MDNTQIVQIKPNQPKAPKAQLIAKKKGLSSVDKEKLQLSYWIDCFNIQGILQPYIHSYTQPTRSFFQ